MATTLDGVPAKSLLVELELTWSCHAAPGMT